MGNKLKALGDSAKKTQYTYDHPALELLESFPNPMLQGGTYKSVVHIEAPEFSSLCPITGQPDFATIVVHYIPDRLCVESKSFKLYLGSFRMFGEFHESCVNRICQALVVLLVPLDLVVEGRFAPRGGISFWPKISYVRSEQNAIKKD